MFTSAKNAKIFVIDMSKENLVAKIGQIATRGKHKDGFLYVGTVEPKGSTSVFFYLIEIDTPWVNGEKVRDAIVFQLLESRPDDRVTIENFESTVKRINNSLADITEQGEHEWIGKLNSIIGVVSNSEIIFSQTGNISGYLFRANKISHITEKSVENEEKLPQKTFLSIINGEIAEGDKVIIANSKLYSHFSLERLRQNLTSFKYRDAIDEIARSLRKIKVRDVNLMIFEFASQNESNGSEKPEIILLDEIPESKILHYSKIIYRGTITGVKATGKGAKSAVSWWEKNIQPKISDRFKKTSSKAKEVGSSALKPVSEKISGLPKINYFNQKQRSKGSKAKDFLTNISYWIKELLKPENRKYLYIGLIVILLVFGFIKIQINSKNNSGIKKQADSLASLNSARDLYSTAIDDIGLNRDGGKEKLIQSRDLAKQAIESPAIEEEAKNLLFQIQAKLDELNNTQRIKSGTEANYTISGDQPLIYAVGADIYSFSSQGEINLYDTRKKNSSQVASIGENAGRIISLAFSDSANLFYIYTDQQKILTYDLSSSTVSDLLTSEGEWGKSVAISIFSTNIYLLDASDGVVWKHVKQTQGYSTGVDYTKNVDRSLSGAKSLAIDGDIYILTSEGSVIKIRSSVEDNNFAIFGTPTPEDSISGPEKIFTNSDTASIFIFDKGNNRVLEYAKTGQYKRQFAADNDISINDFAVNTKMQKLWLLSGNNVFEIEI